MDQPMMANVPRKVMDRREIKVPMTNVIENIVQTARPINHMVLEEMCAKPRPDPYRPPIRIRPKTPWDRNKSCFKNYKEDTQVRALHWERLLGNPGQVLRGRLEDVQN